jgi:hypothetical protein
VSMPSGRQFESAEAGSRPRYLLDTGRGNRPSAPDRTAVAQARATWPARVAAPNSQIVVLPGQGHRAIEEAPDLSGNSYCAGSASPSRKGGTTLNGVASGPQPCISANQRSRADRWPGATGNTGNNADREHG